jgi:hypothetical protein
MKSVYYGLREDCVALDGFETFFSFVASVAAKANGRRTDNLNTGDEKPIFLNKQDEMVDLMELQVSEASQPGSTGVVVTNTIYKTVGHGVSFKILAMG